MQTSSFISWLAAWGKILSEKFSQLHQLRRLFSRKSSGATVDRHHLRSEHNFAFNNAHLNLLRFHCVFHTKLGNHFSLQSSCSFQVAFIAKFNQLSFNKEIVSLQTFSMLDVRTSNGLQCNEAICIYLRGMRDDCCLTERNNLVDSFLLKFAVPENKQSNFISRFLPEFNRKLKFLHRIQICLTKECSTISTLHREFPWVSFEFSSLAPLLRSTLKLSRPKPSKVLLTSPLKRA